MLSKNRKGRWWCHQERKAVPCLSDSDRECANADCSRGCDAPWLWRSVSQSLPNAAVSVTRPPPPGEGHQQGTVVQVHFDSGTPKPPAEKCDSFRDSQPVKVVQQRRHVVEFPGSVDQTHRSVHASTGLVIDSWMSHAPVELECYKRPTAVSIQGKKTLMW